MKQLSVTNLSTAIPTASTNYDIKADHQKVKSIQVVWASSTASFGYVIQGSNDGTNFTEVVSNQAISDNSGSTFVQIDGVYDYLYIRVALAKTSGSLTGWSVLAATEPR